MKVGDTVKFKEAIYPDDEIERLEILEDRDDRVLVRSLIYCTDFAVRPTLVYRKKDLIPA